MQTAREQKQRQQGYKSPQPADADPLMPQH
jgi:hypothetical protein